MISGCILFFPTFGSLIYALIKACIYERKSKSQPAWGMQQRLRYWQLMFESICCCCTTAAQAPVRTSSDLGIEIQQPHHPYSSNEPDLEKYEYTIATDLFVPVVEDAYPVSTAEVVGSVDAVNDNAGSADGIVSKNGNDEYNYGDNLGNYREGYAYIDDID